MKKQIQFSIGALLIIVIAIVLVIYNEQISNESSKSTSKTTNKIKSLFYEQQKTNDGDLLIHDYSPTLGSENAKVTIVEFFDPACETCRKFYPFVKRLMSKNPGKIRLVLRYAPLHKGSDYVVKFLEASRLQNKFWETLEATYEAQPLWASHHNPQPEKLWTLLDYVGLDLNKLKDDMQDPTIAQRVQQDIADGRRLRVTKTPGFFVNGKPLVQFGYEQLQQLVESEIRRNY